MLQERPGRLSVRCCNGLGYGEPGCPIVPNEQVWLRFRGLPVGDVDTKEAGGVAFERLMLGLVPFDIRQAQEALSLQTPVQRRPVSGASDGCRA